MTTTIAFQGKSGAYSEIAIRKLFRDAETIGMENFSNVFDKVKEKEADFGIIPIENSTTGTISETYDLLLKNDLLFIVGETNMEINHAILVEDKNVKLEEIRKVYSHPQALLQCREFIEENCFEPIFSFDTAGSAEILKREKNKDAAIIASEFAGELYGLKILRKNISPEKNITRFVFISRNEYVSKKRKEELKTTIVFQTRHIPGALVKSLIGFSDNKINLTKIESRPIKDEPWEYSFFLDFEGGKEENKVEEAFENLKEHTQFLRILGSYPKMLIY